MAADLAQFEQDYKSKATIIELDVDQRDSDPNFKKYGDFEKAQYIPETVVLRDGQVTLDKVGAMTTQDLKNATDAALH